MLALNAFAPSSAIESGQLDMSPAARLKDAEDDVLRLHREKMKFFERVIELERQLAYWMPKERPQFGAPGSKDVDVAEAQRKWDAFHVVPSHEQPINAAPRANENEANPATPITTAPAGAAPSSIAPSELAVIAKQMRERAAMLEREGIQYGTELAWLDEWVAKLEAFVPSATQRRDLPPELFDGYAVCKALGDGSGVSQHNVAAVLDAVVRLIRAGQ